MTWWSSHRLALHLSVDSEALLVPGRKSHRSQMPRGPIWGDQELIKALRVTVSVLCQSRKPTSAEKDQAYLAFCESVQTSIRSKNAFLDQVRLVGTSSLALNGTLNHSNPSSKSPSCGKTVYDKQSFVCSEDEDTKPVGMTRSDANNGTSICVKKEPGCVTPDRAEGDESQRNRSTIAPHTQSQQSPSLSKAPISVYSSDEELDELIVVGKKRHDPELMLLTPPRSEKRNKINHYIDL